MMASDTLLTLQRLDYPLRPRLFTDDIAFWRILYQLDHDFLLTVKQFFFYGYGKSLLVWTQDGRVYGCGDNHDGLLGVGLYKKKHMWIDEPLEVVELRGRQIVQMASCSHVMALTADGDLFGWGGNYNGEVGVATYYKIFSPVLVKSKVLLVRCGHTYTLALDFEGCVWCWGNDDDFGTENQTDQHIPQKLAFPTKVIDLQCNCVSEEDLNLALTIEYEVYLWGGLYDSQVPFKVDMPRTSPVVAISPFYRSYLLFTANGEAFHYNVNREVTQIDLPEPIAAVLIVAKDNASVVVTKTFTGKLLCIRNRYYFRYETDYIIAQSSLTSPADLYAFYCSSMIYITPDLVTVSDKARAQLDHFNNPQQRSVRLSPNLYVNRVLLEQQQPFFNEKNRLKDVMAEKSALFHEHVVYSYMHYIHRGILIDSQELAYSLWTQAHYLHDIKLQRRLTGDISFLLCHLYLRHRATLMEHFKQHLHKFYYSLTVKSRTLFDSTSRLDDSLKARIIRWFLERTIYLANPDSSTFIPPLIGFSVKNLFESNVIHPPPIDESEESDGLGDTSSDIDSESDDGSNWI